MLARWLSCLGFLLCLGTPCSFAESADTSVFRIEVRLPLLGNAEERLIRQLREISEQPIAGQRPIVILEFASVRPDERAKSDRPTTGQAIGLGTQFERALRLARWLSGPEGMRIRSIAYLKRDIAGHAVLLALACEEIAMAPTATLGNASADEATRDRVIEEAYLEIRSKREAIPEAVVRALLDPRQGLHRVELLEEGERFVNQEPLETLRREGKMTKEENLLPVGAIVELSGTELRRYRWVANLIPDPQQLTTLLQLPSIPRWISASGEPWRPVVISLHGRVHSRQIQRLIRALEESIAKDRANLLLLDIDSPGGSLADSMRFAQHIASFSPDALETVAYVSGKASGDAAIIAMSCRSLFLHPDAILGGEGDAVIQPKQLLELYPSFDDLGQKVGRSPGELFGPVSPNVETYRFTNPLGQMRWDTESQIPPGEGWVRGDRLELAAGLRATDVQSLHWLRSIQPSLNAVGVTFDIESLPEPTRSSQLEAWVQRLAEIPGLAGLLLFFGFSLFMTEITTPGASLPGLLSAICFGLFFWIQFLNGTLEWLEILLFVGGVVFLLIELLILPGFGAFGFTGLAMLFAALLLASQSFIFPGNRVQWNELAGNMGQLVAALLGILIGLYLVRHQLENLPMFRWLKLEPVSVEMADTIEEREAIVHWEHLARKTGTTITRCNPAGKVKIGSETVNVITTGSLLEEDTPIRVVEVRGNTVVVEPIDPPLPS